MDNEEGYYLDSVVDLAKKYGFKIISRDEVSYTFWESYTNHLTYIILRDDSLYLVVTNRTINSYYNYKELGLDEFSGHGVDFLEKDYQIVYHDERDSCIITHELFQEMEKEGDLSDYIIDKIKRHFRKKKIDSLLGKIED